jgi:glucosamine--fructose-6-phosphate aminotransferase (isomerizing)
MGTYQTDILAQPAALRDTLESLEANHLPAEINEGIHSGRWIRVVLTGMGSSYFALLPLYRRLLETGMAAWLIETSELIYSQNFFTPNTLMIVASQSGASIETVRLLDIIGNEQTVIGLTNTTGSPLSERASFTILTRAGEEATVSCKTYLAALAAQTWLGDQLILGTQDFTGFQILPQIIQAYLDNWKEHIASLRKVLKGIEQVYLAGRGNSIASAGTGGLILKESVHIAAEGMSSASFRHGPFEMVGPRSFVLIFSGTGITIPLNRKLLADITSVGGSAALVEVGSEASVFHLPNCPDPALPILEILPVQMMTLALADLRNLRAGSFSLGTKITITE